MRLLQRPQLIKSIDTPITNSNIDMSNSPRICWRRSQKSTMIRRRAHWSCYGRKNGERWVSPRYDGDYIEMVERCWQCQIESWMGALWSSRTRAAHPPLQVSTSRHNVYQWILTRFQATNQLCPSKPIELYIHVLGFDLAVLTSSARQAAYACFDDFTSYVSRIHTLMALMMASTMY